MNDRYTAEERWVQQGYQVLDVRTGEKETLEKYAQGLRLDSELVAVSVGPVEIQASTRSECQYGCIVVLARDETLELPQGIIILNKRKKED